LKKLKKKKKKGGLLLGMENKQLPANGKGRVTGRGERKKPGLHDLSIKSR